MRAVDQTVFDPVRGNCFSACVASIFEMPLERIPFFMTKTWWSDFQAWLAQLGLSATCYPTEAGYVPPGFTIASGPSQRFAGRLHSCVARDGIVVHDPHPSRDGLPSGIIDYIAIHGPDRTFNWFNGIA